MDNFQKIVDSIDDVYTALDNLTREVYESDDDDLINSFESHMEEYSEPAWVLDGWNKVLNELWHDLDHREKSYALEQITDHSDSPEVRLCNEDAVAEQWFLKAFWKGEVHYIFATSKSISFYRDDTMVAKDDWPNHIGDPRLAATYFLLDNWEERPDDYVAPHIHFEEC